MFLLLVRGLGIQKSSLFGDSFNGHEAQRLNKISKRSCWPRKNSRKRSYTDIPKLGYKRVETNNIQVS